MTTSPLSINLDLSGIVTAMPIIVADHLSNARLKAIDQISSDKGITLVWTYELTEPAPTQDGGQVSPGYPIKDFIQLYSKPDSKRPDWFKEVIAKHIDACLGTGDPNNKAGKPVRPELNAELLPQLIGRPVIIRFGVKEFNSRVSNEIKGIYNPADLNK